MVAVIGALSAHPLHTSLAEVSVDPGGGVSVSLRVFVDDFTAAAEAYRKRVASGGGSAHAPLVSYALASFSLADGAGHRIHLQSCGGRRVGDLMWLCFRGRAPRSPSGLRVASRILFEMFDDQINIVQIIYRGRKVHLLFTPGEGPKGLP